MFHININSLSKHRKDLTSLFDDLQYEFKIIAIPETRLVKSKDNFEDLSIPGYMFLSNETESFAGGIALYIHIQFKRRDDLSSQFYVSKQLRNTFSEILLPNQPNMIVGCVYKHPHMSINDFNKLYLFCIKVMKKIKISLYSEILI